MGLAQAHPSNGKYTSNLNSSNPATIWWMGRELVSEINSVLLQLQVQPQELHPQGCMGDQLLGIHVTTLQLSVNIILYLPVLHQV